MKIQESAENYLETIYMLHQRNGAVRSIDIVNELSFSKPSVSVAMKNLRENGYVEMDADGFITLCPKGQEIAERMYERHVFLSRWLTKLGVDPDVAVEDACRIEHVISAESFAAIKRHVSGPGGSSLCRGRRKVGLYGGPGKGRVSSPILFVSSGPTQDGAGPGTVS